MTPKEKAELMMNWFNEIHIDEEKDIAYRFTHLSLGEKKMILNKSIDEILKLDLHDVGDYRNDQSSSDDFSTATWYINYWEEVKQEIEKL